MIAALVAARFAHFAAVTFLFGTLLFPAYAFSAGERLGPRVVALTAALHRPLAWAALVAAVSGLAWFAGSVAQMAGDPSAAASPDLLLGMDADPARAHRWYEQASQNGNAQAAERLKILASLSAANPSD